MMNQVYVIYLFSIQNKKKYMKNPFNPMVISWFPFQALDITASARSRAMGQWSSGYDVALTTRRSPVQFRPGPLLLSPSVCVEIIKKHSFG